MLKLTLDLMDGTTYIAYLETIDGLSIKGPSIAQNKDNKKYSILTLNTNAKETAIRLPTEDTEVGRLVAVMIMDIIQDVYTDMEGSYLEYKGRWVELSLSIPILFQRAVEKVDPDAAIPDPKDDEKYKALLAKLYKDK